MSVLQSLWLPILLSGVFVFIVSSIIHMALPWHKNDMKPMPNEDQIMALLRPMNIPPGDYMLPRCKDMKDMKTPEFKEKMRLGPVMVATVCPNGINMGRSMTLWFLYCVVISYFAGYVAAHALAPLPFLTVHERPLRFVLVAAFLGYAGALWQSWIWYGRSLSTTIKSSIDALIYAAVTAWTFQWLWPHS